jgi:hypothetical protein
LFDHILPVPALNLVEPLQARRLDGTIFRAVRVFRQMLCLVAYFPFGNPPASRKAEFRYPGFTLSAGPRLSGSAQIRDKEKRAGGYAAD